MEQRVFKNKTGKEKDMNNLKNEKLEEIRDKTNEITIIK